MDEDDPLRARRGVVRALACLALVALLAVPVVAGVTRGDSRTGTSPDAGHAAAPPEPPATTESGAPTQPAWDPFELDRSPRSSLAFAAMLGPLGRIRPKLADARPIREDPMAAVVLASVDKGDGVRLLGMDGGWRTAPAAMETNQAIDHPPDPPAISSDGTTVAAATEEGIRVLDVTTGEVEVVGWPRPLAPPWDWAPGLRWLPGDDALLVLHWKRPWIVGLDGDAAPAPYPTEDGVSDVFGIDPDGTVLQNDYPRTTLVTWQDDRVVDESPFVQCERLTAAYGMVACTTGSLRYAESGPVVVDAASGELLAYAPIKDRSAVYSDNGHLTALGFLDPDTVLLIVSPADFRAADPPPPTWHLVAWSFHDGTFERIATGDGHLRDVAVSASAMR